MKSMFDDNQDFLLLMEYGIGGEVDTENFKWKDDKPNGGYYDYRTDHVELSKELGLCNGFRIWNSPTPERIKHAMDGGYGVLVDTFISAGRWKVWADQHGRELREYLDSVIDCLRELIKEDGENIWVNVLAETDNHPWIPWEIDVNNRSETFEKLRSYLATNEYFDSVPPKPEIDWRDLGNPPAVDPANGLNMSPFVYMKERGIKPEDLNMVNLCCQTFSPHLMYSLGAEAVWPEGNVGNNHQITIAFIRGAARQYGKSWIYDAAPFSCQGDDVPMVYDYSRRRFSGFSENYMLRTWLVSYLSGARSFLFQSSDTGFFTRDENHVLELSPQGEIAKDFADFALRNHPKRGKSRAPVALLMAQDHGYTPSARNQPRLFWRKLPNDRDNNAIEGFMRLAFPKCNETNGFSFDESKWAPNGSWKNQKPWIKPGLKGMKDYAHSFHKTLHEGLDQRELERGFLTQTTWGDSFDVLVDNAPSEALSKYKAVILLGSIKLDKDLKEKLHDYVKKGGRVLLNASSADVHDSDFLGVKLKNERGECEYHSHSLLTGRLFTEGHYEYEKMEIEDAETLIEAGFFGESGNPLLTRRKFGKGEVWLTTVPEWQLVDALDLSWAEACKEAIDEFIRPVLSLEINGPQLEWIVNDTEDGIWVSFFNNSGQLWKGTATVLDDFGRASAREIWTEKSCQYIYDDSGKIILQLEIPAWDFKIIEIKKRK